MSPNATLPHHITSSEQFVLLEILQGVDQHSQLYDSSGPESDLSIGESEDDSVGSYKFLMSSPVTLSSKGRLVFVRYGM